MSNSSGLCSHGLRENLPLTVTFFFKWRVSLLFRVIQVFLVRNTKLKVASNLQQSFCYMA